MGSSIINDVLSVILLPSFSHLPSAACSATLLVPSDLAVEDMGEGSKVSFEASRSEPTGLPGLEVSGLFWSY